MKKSDNPIFIIASERSGTNILRKRLTESQNLYLGASPIHFLKHLYYQQPYFGSLKNDNNFKSFIQQAIDMCTFHYSPWKISWTSEKLLLEFGSKKRDSINLMHFMMNKYAFEQGFSGYICKDNFLYEFALDIANSIPGAKFIYLYRDPRDYVLSKIKIPGQNKCIYYHANYWSYEQTKSISVYEKLKFLNKCISLSYEEFIQNEKKKIDEILKFLKINFNFSKNYKDIIKVHVHEWKNLEAETIKNNHSKYLKELNPKKIRDIERICNVQMKYLGYKFSKYYDDKKNYKFIIVMSYFYHMILLKLLGKKSLSSMSKKNIFYNFKKINYRSDSLL